MIDWARLDQGIGDTAGQPASSRIRQWLIAAIQDGQLQPGCRLKEVELVKSLDVSRTPLREALAGLRAEGIVDSDHDGLRVRRLDWRDIRALYTYRGMLEGMAAKLAAAHAHEAERRIIEQLRQKEADHISRGVEAAVLAGHNRRFHHAILQAAGNPFLAEGLERLSRLMVLLGKTAYSLGDRVEAIAGEHQMITAAIMTGDAGAAEAAMQAHISNALEARLTLLNMSGIGEMD